mmetsp:Transcript_88440/g.286396  ORF Transcript_88440/g.286396 Transcript_88440/m.286396 type:complete len:86 (-) Transcript_88440:339-596(-)
MGQAGGGAPHGVAPPSPPCKPEPAAAAAAEGHGGSQGVDPQGAAADGVPQSLGVATQCPECEWAALFGVGSFGVDGSRGTPAQAA